MHARFSISSALVTLALILLAAHADAQGFAPAEAARRMTVPAGLEMQLVASEPMVRQPVAMEGKNRQIMYRTPLLRRI